MLVVAGLLALAVVVGLTWLLLRRDELGEHERRVLAAAEDGAAAAALAPGTAGAEDDDGDLAEARLVAGGGNRLARRRALRTRDKEERKADGEARVQAMNQRMKEEEDRRDALAREADMEQQMAEEREAILEERRAAAAKAELDEWSAMMSVDEAGEVDAPDDIEARYRASLLAAIHTRKVVALEALSAEFDRPVDAIVATMDALRADGTLTGIYDDRGRFVHITTAEYAAVAQFVNQRGRVAVADLAAASSKLVDMQVREA